MNKQEFIDKVVEITQKIPVVPDREYSIIEKVYTFHPAISETEGKQQIDELYVNFGMALIVDMVPRAELMAKKEEELRAARWELKKLQEEIEEIRKGGAI